mmetsp:Transcript_768/g.2361  ORF Transcript_768/g.2361 Transcript_768/m.2361 type:complete len:254 (+) Transcript_768:512-1273(+)
MGLFAFRSSRGHTGGHRRATRARAPFSPRTRKPSSSFGRWSPSYVCCRRTRLYVDSGGTAPRLPALPSPLLGRLELPGNWRTSVRTLGPRSAPWTPPRVASRCPWRCPPPLTCCQSHPLPLAVSSSPTTRGHGHRRRAVSRGPHLAPSHAGRHTRLPRRTGHTQRHREKRTPTRRRRRCQRRRCSRPSTSHRPAPLSPRRRCAASGLAEAPRAYLPARTQARATHRPTRRCTRTRSRRQVQHRPTARQPHPSS